MANPFTNQESDLEEGLTPPVVRTASPTGESPERIPPQRLVQASRAPGEKTRLLGGPVEEEPQQQQPLYSAPTSTPSPSVRLPDQRYIGDDDELLEEGEYPGQRKPKSYCLLNFWASALALHLSVLLLVSAGSSFKGGQLSSGVTVTCTLAMGLGALSVVVESAHMLRIKALQWRMGRHALLHFFLGVFAVLPYLQGRSVLGLLFALHLLPAILFYMARARRERGLPKS